MPKASVLNENGLHEKLRIHLSSVGPSKAKDLCDFLKISQPAFSRLIASINSVIRIGQGSQTLYAWTKANKIPVFSIDEKGNLDQVAFIHPIAPKGFYFEAQNDFFSARLYESLPYFFEDLRPAGFLGRLVPKIYPDLNLPPDISIWSDDDCLVYLSRYGWDLVGNIIIGENSYDNYIKTYINHLDVIDQSKRSLHYPRVANLVLNHGIPGSSAAGEQAKFLSIKKTKKGLAPVLVKFSPPLKDDTSQRIADLLICEHIVHQILEKNGKTSLRSSLVKGGKRLFLEMERFDRNISGGRRGIISLKALDLEFVGQLKSWSETAESLFKQKIIDQTAYQNILWLESFGKMIGNSDRHLGNISFFCQGEKILGLAPVYDMLPMIYAPQQNQLVERLFEPETPKFYEIPVWNDALTAAKSFWQQVEKNPDISNKFKKLISENKLKLKKI